MNKINMKIKPFLSLIVALSLIFSLSGCRNRGEEENPNSLPETPAEEELVIYHNSTELAPMLMSLAEEYSSVRAINIGASSVFW